jgi:tRNA(Leu) C34 or U34 (ribose-2'-O)-methylase TrmL
LIAAALCRAYRLRTPNQATIFDEPFYVNSARLILGIHVHGGPYVDQPLGLDPNHEHPPLGKLLIAGSMRLFGDNGFGWRLPSLLAGIACIALVYAIVRAVSPDGWLAVLPSVGVELADLDPGPDPLVLVCVGVEKPGNLGAMLRTAEAAGVDAVVASPAGTDWGNPNVVRASRGSLFAVPVAEAEQADLVRWLQEQEVSIAVADPEHGVPYTSADLRGGIAIVVGAESEGLQDSWRKVADVSVRVPMFGRMNSLNVSTSAALVIYESLRQRGRLA